MTPETVLTNAVLVLPDRAIQGTLVISGSTIAEVQPGCSHLAAAQDLGGDFVIPGVVDLHTDNLERQVYPRSNARWPSRSAVIAHDTQCAAAGVTTVLDAFCLGDLGFDKDRVRTFREGVVDLDVLGEAGLLRAEHFLHLRCEVPAADMLDLFDSVSDHPRLRMISLMDHTPGVGQYADLDRYRVLRRQGGFPDHEIERRIIQLQSTRARLREPNRRALLDRVVGRNVALASHDDRTETEIAENAAAGISVSEFPVTMIAARAARAAGMHVIAGAPNLVRGGSHAGNVGVAELLEHELVDGFASDYVPSSMIEAAFNATRHVTLASAVAMITDRPARIAGLHERGRIAHGLRADFVRLYLHHDLPIVRQVWRGGERVA